MPLSAVPPVPKNLREMLKDYPEHIDRLQKLLTEVAEDPRPYAPRFEVVVWALEGRLGTFKSEARKELAVAKASGDPETIEKADAKERLMSQAAWKHVWIGDTELWDYIQRV